MLVLITLTVYAARVAVYDVKPPAPRVVLVEPKMFRSYLDEIAATLTNKTRQLENSLYGYAVVENFVMLAVAPQSQWTTEIPWVFESKDLVLRKTDGFGTSSATEEMEIVY